MLKQIELDVLRGRELTREEVRAAIRFRMNDALNFLHEVWKNETLFSLLVDDYYDKYLKAKKMVDSSPELFDTVSEAVKAAK